MRAVILFSLIGLMAITTRATAQILVTSQISSSLDDAEENLSNGFNYLDSSDLELGSDPGNGGSQLVGLRFTNLMIPSGAVIQSASIEFRVDEVDSEATSVTIRGQLNPNPDPFSASDFNISSRGLAGYSRYWESIPAWTTVGSAQQTPDLSLIVQEIVNLEGWAAGNAMVFVIQGSGQRVAESFDGNAGLAPTLSVVYAVPEIPSVVLVALGGLALAIGSRSRRRAKSKVGIPN